MYWPSLILLSDYTSSVQLMKLVQVESDPFHGNKQEAKNLARTSALAYWHLSTLYYNVTYSMLLETQIS